MIVTFCAVLYYANKVMKKELNQEVTIDILLQEMQKHPRSKSP